MIAAAVRVGQPALDDVHGEVDESHDADADQDLAHDDAVVVDLYPQDAREQGEREEHAHPHGVV